MRAFDLAREFRPRLRVVLASLMVVFVLATTAHFGHQHEQADRTASHHLCGFCVSLSGAADAPREHAIALIEPAFFAVVTLTTHAHLDRFVLTSARPRAPPLA